MFIEWHIDFIIVLMKTFFPFGKALCKWDVVAAGQMTYFPPGLM